MKILIADDHKMIMDGYCMLISREYPYAQISTATNKTELYNLLQHSSYDILLQDIRFGDSDARDFLEEIKITFPALKIIIVTSLSDVHTLKKLSKMGFDGLVIKSESSENITAAIATCLNNKTYLSPFSKQQLNAVSETTNLVLSRREKEVLTEILKEKSIKEIAEALYISDKTVEMHRSNLFVKLDVKNITGLVKKVILLNLLED